MGTKYSTQAASGYNSSPPPDDGSVTAANKITWAGIKSKLSDAIKNLADAINSAIVNALNYTTTSTSVTYTTVAGDNEALIEASGTITVSLGDATTMGAGYRAEVYNKGTGTVTVAVVTATDTLSGRANGTVTLPPGASMLFVVATSGVGYDIRAATGFAPFVLTGAAGTNTATAAAPANLLALYSGLQVVWTPAVTNTGATTLNITPSGGSALTAKNVFVHGGACTAGELRATIPYKLEYDGTQFNVLGAGLDGFADQAANAVLAGPSTGANAQPAFRALVRADLTGLIVEGTAVATTSGTTASFTGLPTGIKKITFMVKGVSTGSTSSLMLQLSQSATFKTSGYNGGAVASAGSSTAVAGAGFPITVSAIAADTYKGQVVLTRESSSNNTWTYAGMIYMESGTNTPADFYTSAGEVSLAGTLDGIRLTTASGDTFDAGEVNIQYE